MHGIESLRVVSLSEVEVFDAGDERAITQFGSRGAHWAGIARSGGEAAISRMRFEAGAILGMHPAAASQLFIVVEGAGWVRVRDHPATDVAVGQVVMWRAGEEHESGSAAGMTAVIVEAEVVTTTSPG
ncbi:hypothetical protein BH24ACT15_BH24ACT15_26220 [soil metagenome]